MKWENKQPAPPLNRYRSDANSRNETVRAKAMQNRPGSRRAASVPQCRGERHRRKAPNASTHRTATDSRMVQAQNSSREGSSMAAVTEIEGRINQPVMSWNETANQTARHAAPSRPKCRTVRRQYKQEPTTKCLAYAHARRHIQRINPRPARPTPVCIRDQNNSGTRRQATTTVKTNQTRLGPEVTPYQGIASRDMAVRGTMALG